MKYLLLIYNNTAYLNGLTEEERQEIFGSVDGIMKELEASGELIGGQALADASQARVVRVRDGVTVTTDGPYLEAKEHIGGLWILETADADEALAWARKGAEACRFSVEVREIFFVPAPEKD